MKLAFAVVAVVVAVVGAHAQFYDVPPAPSMFAAQAGTQGFVNENGMPIPAAPSMNAIMSGAAPYGSFAQPMPPAAFVEQGQAQPMQQQMQMQQQISGAAPYFATHEADHAAEEEEEETTTTEEADESEGENESEESDESEGEEEADAEGEAEGDDMRFAEKKKKGFGKIGHALRHAGRKSKHAAHHLVRTLAGAKRQNGRGFRRGPNGGLVGPKGKPLFAPRMGKPDAHARSPSTKTPKAAGGKALPPMPAPLPKKFKVDCKINPGLCIDAETPAEGEEPGDHSPKAVFKKKMEVIKKSLMVNNRNIAQESKWIDQVETIMKQYALKLKKVKEHIADERKAIKELLRQRRIILNEKKQKELESKLKMATTELAALTDALSQVQKKEKELGSGKGLLGSKIKVLNDDLKKLRTDNEADKTAALKKAD